MDGSQKYDMKEIRIFVASSREMVAERNVLAYFALKHEDEFENRGFRVRLSKWEYVDPHATEEHTEERYLQAMRESDAALILFRNVLGKYTRMELEEAVAAERNPGRGFRLKTHRVLFMEGANVRPSEELAAWRVSLPKEGCAAFADARELERHFLALIDRLATGDLQELNEAAKMRTVTAFFAADDELAADRDAFADLVVQVNDELKFRGVRLKMKFYTPEEHRRLLDSSEMALVVYHTQFGPFGKDQMDEACERTIKDLNPRRLYVFFRDEQGLPIEKEFAAFKDGFEKERGHFICRFENVNTLKLNFLFSLEKLIGCDQRNGMSKLHGQEVRVGDYVVGNVTQLPSVRNNKALMAQIAHLDELQKEVSEKYADYEKRPYDEQILEELRHLGEEEDRLQSEVDQELARSLSLAKRIAAISIGEMNAAHAQACSRIEAGDIKGAIDILDAASGISRLARLAREAEMRVDAESVALSEMQRILEFEQFRISAILSYVEKPFVERFNKAKSIYEELERQTVAIAENLTPKNRPAGMLALVQMMDVFGETCGDNGCWDEALAVCEKELKIVENEKLDEDAGNACDFDFVVVRLRLSACYANIWKWKEATSEYEQRVIPRIRQRVGRDVTGASELLLCYALVGCANVCMFVDTEKAEKMLKEALELAAAVKSRCDEVDFDDLRMSALIALTRLHAGLQKECVERELVELLDLCKKYENDGDVAHDENLANACLLMSEWQLDRDVERAEIEGLNALSIVERLMKMRPLRYKYLYFSCKKTLAAAHQNMGKYERAAVEFSVVLHQLVFLELPPKTEKIHMAWLFLRIGLMQKRLRYVEEAEGALKASLRYYEEIAAEDPVQYSESVTVVKNQLSEMRRSVGDVVRHGFDVAKESLETGGFRIIKSEFCDELNIGKLYWCLRYGIEGSSDVATAHFTVFFAMNEMWVVMHSGESAKGVEHEFDLFCAFTNIRKRFVHWLRDVDSNLMAMHVMMRYGAEGSFADGFWRDLVGALLSEHCKYLHIMRKIREERRFSPELASLVPTQDLTIDVNGTFAKARGKDEILSIYKIIHEGLRYRLPIRIEGSCLVFDTQIGDQATISKLSTVVRGEIYVTDNCPHIVVCTLVRPWGADDHTEQLAVLVNKYNNDRKGEQWYVIENGQIGIRRVWSIDEFVYNIAMFHDHFVMPVMLEFYLHEKEIMEAVGESV